MRNIRAHIAAERSASAARILRELVDRTGMLVDFPEAGEARYRLGAGVRRLSEPPYLIFYRVAAGEVEILRILHHARRVTRRLLREN